MNSRLSLILYIFAYLFLPVSAKAELITIGTPIATVGNNYVILGSNGALLDSDRGTGVSMSWDGTVFTSSSDYTGPGSVSNMTLSTSALFGGKLVMTITDVQVFAPGTYSFDTSLGGGQPESELLNMTVGPDQLGAHMLIDMNVWENLDVAIVWDKNAMFDMPSLYPDTGPWDLASVDGNGDGIPGIPMVAGAPFPGYNWNFNLNVPIPAAVWLFISGLLGLIGVARKQVV